MSKLIDRPLQVVEQAQGAPRAFRWKGRRIVVSEVIDAWEEAGCWWRGEAARRVYRVLVAEGTIYELHHQPSDGWRLYRVYD